VNERISASDLVAVRRFDRRTALRGAAIAAAGGLAARAGLGLESALAQAATPAADLGAYHDTILTSIGYEYGLPARMTGGWNRFTLRNRGVEDHHAMIMKLADGKTFDDLTAASKETLKSMGPHGVTDFSAMTALGTALGGPGSVSPGEESSTILELAPGQYAVLCLIPGKDGMPHYAMGMMHELEVTDAAASAPAGPPATALEIELKDFAFSGLPKQVPAGEHVIQITNAGDELHETVFYRLADGVGFDQALEMLGAPPSATPAAEGAAAPFTAIGGCAPMSPGAANWAIETFSPGEHFAICFVPDLAKQGMPHFAEGMVQPFTVA